MSIQTRSIILSICVIAWLLTACAGSASVSTDAAADTPSGAQLTPATLPAVSNGENGGEGGGVEAALVTYSDSAQGFAISHPGPWTQDASVTKGVKFLGGDDSLSVEFVTPANGTNALAYAKSDSAALAAAFLGFNQLSLAPSTEVKDAIVLGFEAQGTSVVTGKVFKAHNERYYLPLADGRLALITVVGPENHYDREGVRDIALTFRDCLRTSEEQKSRGNFGNDQIHQNLPD